MAAITKKSVGNDSITIHDVVGTSSFARFDARDQSTPSFTTSWNEFRLAADLSGARTTAPVASSTPAAQTASIISAAPEGLQTLFQTGFDGFTAAGFAPGASGTRLDSNVFRVLGLSDLAAPAYGFTSPTGTTANDFARGVIQGSADPTTGGIYSPSANAALVVQATGSDFVEANGAFEARIQNTSGFTATGFAVDFDWAWRNSGNRASSLQLSYSSDGVTFIAAPTSAFTTPGAATSPVPAVFSLTTAMVSIADLVVADGGYLYLRWSHLSSSGSGNRDEFGIDNLSVKATLTDASTLTFVDVTVTEGNSGTTFATITLTRTSGEGTASIAYATADGSAQASSDYLAQSGVVTFAAGETSKTIQIAILGDTRNEPNETFFVNFSDAQGFLAPDTQARVTITNDDTGPVAIYDIQGLGHRSAYEGLTVQTAGVVTALRTTGSDRGFFLQDATGDGDMRTSDAIFVSTGSVSPTVAVGNAITLSGTVAEYTQNAANLTVTRLTGATAITVTEANATLPAATLISTEAGGYAPPTQVVDDDRLQSYDPNSDGIDFYESLEGMLVTVRTPLVVSSTDGIGQTYVVANGGIGATGINERYGITISAGDNAPEKIKIYAPGGGTFDQGDVLADVNGILTYFGNAGGTSAGYELDPIGALSVTTDRAAPTRETSTLVGDADHMTIASFNVENADPGDGAQKFGAIATEVTTALRNPDVIALQEIQDADGAGTGTDTSGAATAQAIIDAIVAAGGPTYRYTEIAPAYGTTGGEPGGNIRNGFLYNPDRVTLDETSVRLIEDQAFTGSRRPLIATFKFNGEDVTVVNVHSTSRGGSDTLFGAIQPPAQAGDGSRTAQAAAIKAYIDGVQGANPDANVVTLGDFNGYYYEAALQRLTSDGKLANLYDLLPVEERYSYLFEGYLQAFDNIVVSKNLLDSASFDVVHYNAEQPGTVYQATDHDQPLARLYVPRANTAPTDLAIDNAAVIENAAPGTRVGVVTAQDTGALSYSLTDDAGGRFAVDAATGIVTTRVAFDFEATPAYTITARATDAGGLFVDKQITVQVIDQNPENVIGSNGNDSAIGGAGNDVFAMFGGNDRVDGGEGFDTVVFGYTLGAATTITRTGVHALTISGPEGTDTLLNIEALRFANGTVNLDSSNRLVDNLFYLERNPEVLAAETDPATHYAQFGAAEGRDPNAFFSTSGYLGANLDVAAAGVNPLTHYNQFGAGEGRDPSAAFDTALYLLHNPDVASANVNPLDHYLNYGRFEGRASYAAIGDDVTPIGFDAEYYLLSNPDVAASGTDPYTHYATTGWREGRDPNALFDTSDYLRANPDVATAGVNPLEHFNNFGWREGRDPSGAFDTKAYLADNPDVAASGINPLTHYLEFGAYELRDPHADGILTGTSTVIA
ncbi:cadherin domain-containing protein [Sphingomonas sp. RHCKR47]|uniref:Calx-beta domain-containing protein n=1 Tax=Sphingomonas citricola TaxID=2862498 RepID=UPI001CA53166|nr:Calx-beta domain-containing protein [Sphingomonas citricola]MBW6525057.1 cadherin domain-containing protein [Sphingomonas citricola]